MSRHTQRKNSSNTGTFISEQKLDGSYEIKLERQSTPADTVSKAPDVAPRGHQSGSGNLVAYGGLAAVVVLLVVGGWFLFVRPHGGHSDSGLSNDLPAVYSSPGENRRIPTAETVEPRPVPSTSPAPSPSNNLPTPAELRRPGVVGSPAQIRTPNTTRGASVDAGTTRPDTGAASGRALAAPTGNAPTPAELIEWQGQARTHERRPPVSPPPTSEAELEGIDDEAAIQGSVASGSDDLIEPGEESWDEGEEDEYFDDEYFDEEAREDEDYLFDEAAYDDEPSEDPYYDDYDD